MQIALIDGVSEGLKIRDAMNRAGYSEKVRPATATTPSIMQEIRARTGRNLQTLAPRALDVVVEMMENGGNDRIRLEAAKTILDRSGFIAPKATDGAENRDKELHQMSREELQARAARLQNEIADRATPVEIIPNAIPPDPTSAEV